MKPIFKKVEAEYNINLEMSRVEYAPIVKLVNSLIEQAVILNASDIHIEPFSKKINVRYRVDGELREKATLDIGQLPAIVTRIKIMAKMDITERRLPQDGTVMIHIENKKIDLRISTMPTIYGEKVVIRILDRSKFLMAKEELGFTSENFNRFNNLINCPNGILLVTGPTGSGKSTTLYAILSDLNDKKRNITTIEDPVEYSIDGINQTQINLKAQLTFASGLRSILRQDPDIIMIGEIRDTQTAEIAVRASITGHLVLSTLHTNDALSSITRLTDMGIEPYLLATSLVGVIAQRLVRKICVHCKEPQDINDLQRKIMGIDDAVKIYGGRGCKYCDNTGYAGRCGVYEIITITDKLRTAIVNSSSMDTMRGIINAENMQTLKENIAILVGDGITTIDEFNKIIYVVE